MKVLSLVSACAAILISGCSFNDDACEDVAEIARQAAQCQALQNEINRLRSGNQVIRRTELERRYEQDCIDLRFYRDEKQPAICENKSAIEKEKSKMKAEMQSETKQQTTNKSDKK